MQALLEKAGFQPSGTLENLKEDRELVYYMRRYSYDNED
jgi:RimJ/RimL family protein N-acetyltransferase